MANTPPPITTAIITQSASTLNVNIDATALMQPIPTISTPTEPFGSTNIASRLAKLVGANTQPIPNVPTQCFKQITRKAKFKQPAKQDDVTQLTRQINEFTAKLKYETDCASIQITAKGLLQHGQHWAEGKMSASEKYIANAIKELSIPSPDPVSIVKWIVKKTTGDSLPKLESAIRSTIEVLLLIQAVANLVAVLAQLPAKLEACAKDVVHMAEQSALNTVKDFINKEACALQQAISNKVVGALNAADDNGVVVTDVISDLVTVVAVFNQTQAVLNNTVATTVTAVGQAQSQVTNITGGNNYIDTSSVNNFVTSINSGAADTLFTESAAFGNQAPAYCTSLPTINGIAAYSSPLTVNNGIWTGDGLSYTYQWYQGDQTNN